MATCSFSTGELTSRCPGRVSILISSASRRGEKAAARAPFGIGKLLEVVGQPRQCNPIAAIGDEVIARHLRHPAVVPLEKTSSLIDRVDDVRNLQRLRKKIVMNKQIMVRKKDAEVGMGVIPADDVVLRKPLVALCG